MVFEYDLFPCRSTIQPSVRLDTWRILGTRHSLLNEISEPRGARFLLFFHLVKLKWRRQKRKRSWTAELLLSSSFVSRYRWSGWEGAEVGHPLNLPCLLPLHASQLWSHTNRSGCHWTQTSKWVWKQKLTFRVTRNGKNHSAASAYVGENPLQLSLGCFFNVIPLTLAWW